MRISMRMSLRREKGLFGLAASKSAPEVVFPSSPKGA
jgi:hypothetical protein